MVNIHLTKGTDPMKKALLLLLALTLLPLAAARVETADPFSPMTFEPSVESATADHPLVLSGLDFGNGASILRFKAVTESEMIPFRRMLPEWDSHIILSRAKDHGKGGQYGYQVQ